MKDKLDTPIEHDLEKLWADALNKIRTRRAKDPKQLDEGYLDLMQVQTFTLIQISKSIKEINSNLNMILGEIIFLPDKIKNR